MRVVGLDPSLTATVLWLSGTLVPRWQGVMAHNGWIK